MLNKAMEQKIKQGDCLDVRKCGVEVAPGLFELHSFNEDVDYADTENEDWIWSVGERLSDGKIFAATNSRFYQDNDYKCLWLR